ncbi:hypothetical protein [Streptomyces sp. NPDC048188]
MSDCKDQEKRRAARAAFVRDWLKDTGELTDSGVAQVRALLVPTGGASE